MEEVQDQPPIPDVQGHFRGHEGVLGPIGYQGCLIGEWVDLKRGACRSLSSDRANAAVHHPAHRSILNRVSGIACPIAEATRFRPRYGF